MARDARERNFEKALARNLRADTPAASEALPHACPDADILAAYHERLLAPEQMISWKGHIAGCSRCQEVLAQLEATDELPVDAGQQEYTGKNVLTMKEPDLSISASVSGQAPMPAAPRTTHAIESSQRVLKPPRSTNWRWLVPAGAIAAGLLVWVAIHETNPPRLELAKNQPQSPAITRAPAAQSGPATSNKAESDSRLEPPVARTAPASPNAVVEVPKGESVLRESTSSNSPVRADTTKQKPQGMFDRKASPFSPGERRVNPESKQDSLPMNGRDAAPLTLSAPGLVDGQKELEKKAVAIAPPPLPLENAKVDTATSSLQVVPAPPPAAPQKSKAVAGVSGRQTPQQEQQNAMGATTQSVEVVAATLSNFVTIPAPHGKVLWRFASAGIIQRSTNAGSTWAIQKSGVIADLMAGSATSEKVCWIAGRAGTILRTTDGGKHWQKVRSPVEEDFDTVFAVDAQQATVSAASNHKGYKTVDGGLTWTLLPNP